MKTTSEPDVRAADYEKNNGASPPPPLPPPPLKPAVSSASTLPGSHRGPNDSNTTNNPDNTQDRPPVLKGQGAPSSPPATPPTATTEGQPPIPSGSAEGGKRLIMTESARLQQQMAKESNKGKQPTGLVAGSGKKLIVTESARLQQQMAKEGSSSGKQPSGGRAVAEGGKKLIVAESARLQQQMTREESSSGKSPTGVVAESGKKLIMTESARLQQQMAKEGSSSGKQPSGGRAVAEGGKKLIVAESARLQQQMTKEESSSAKGGKKLIIAESVRLQQQMAEEESSSGQQPSGGGVAMGVKKLIMSESMRLQQQVAKEEGGKQPIGDVAGGKARIMTESARLHETVAHGSNFGKQGVVSEGKARITAESARLHQTVAQASGSVKQSSGGVVSEGKARITAESARLHQTLTRGGSDSGKCMSGGVASEGKTRIMTESARLQQTVTQGSGRGNNEEIGGGRHAAPEGKQRIMAESARANEHTAGASARQCPTTSSQDRGGEYVAEGKARLMSECAIADQHNAEGESAKKQEAYTANDRIEEEESMFRHEMQSPTSEAVDQDPGDSTKPKEPGAFAVEGPAPIYLPAEEALLWEESQYEQRDLEEPGLIGEESPQLDDVAIVPGPTLSVDTSKEDLLDRESSDLVFDALVSEVKKKPMDDTEIVSKIGRTGCLVVATVIIVLIVVGVVVAVVVATGNGSDSDNAVSTTPTAAPTDVPIAVAPTTVGRFDECFDSTAALANALRSRRAPYEFVDIALCARQNFEVDDPIDFNTPYLGSKPPLSAQSNIRVKCGNSGLLTDQCVVRAGEALALNTWSFSRDDEAKNVTYEGITFENGATALIILFSGGDITFKNCVFRDFSQKTPIKIDFPGWNDEPTIRQIVTFESCIFENLQYGPTDIPDGEAYPGLSALIVATNSKNTVTVRDSVFRNNDVEAGFSGSAIASLGAQVVVEQSCFQANSAGLSQSPVHLINEFVVDPLLMNNNYVEGVWECDLLSIRGEDGGNATCVNQTSTAESCQSSLKDFIVFW